MGMMYNICENKQTKEGAQVIDRNCLGDVIQYDSVRAFRMGSKVLKMVHR